MHSGMGAFSCWCKILRMIIFAQGSDSRHECQSVLFNSYLSKKNMRPLILLFAVLLFSSQLQAQTSADYAVRLTAETDSLTPSITLKWSSLSGATGYTVSRKEMNASSWGTPIASLGMGDTIYTDLSISADSAYEYRVVKAGNTTAYGYIFAGINRPPRHKRGSMILVVDSLFTDSLQSEIFRLMKDISGDGWSVHRLDVSRNQSPVYVKSLIVNAYNSAPQPVKGLFLLGHVPVPYSGFINPDGHPDHKGAWPADGYYADVNGNFTDNTVDDTLAARPQNRNVPGDGKFDQSTLPSQVELMTGRVDFYDMPAFGMTEIQMMRRYLFRNHLFRNGLIEVENGGLIDDNFGAFGGEAFAATAWKSFPPLAGDTLVHTGDYFSDLSTQAHLFSYGCGGGWYQGAGGVGSTADFVSDSVISVFTVLFGSYFGDWDSQNNFLRAPLASKGLPLACFWGGRPHWVMHHMGMDEPIGYAALWAMNNSSTYFANLAARWVHIALMGDPGLRMKNLRPPDTVTSGTSIPVSIDWIASPDTTTEAYYVYRSATEFGVYELLSPALIQGLSFSDPHPLNGDNYYMIRAAKIHTTASGSYVLLSRGKTAHSYFDLSAVEELNKHGNYRIWPNPSNGNFTVSCEEFSDYETISLSLFNNLSQPCWSLTTNPSGKEIQVKTYGLPAGIYQLRIQSSTKQKFIPVSIIR
jgi:hypothetical protein